MASYLSPEELADNQIRNLQNNTEKWKQGVQRTTKKPMELAKKQIPKMKQNFNRAIDNGTVAAGFDSISDAEWKDQTVSKGGDRIGPGVEKARAKIVAFQQQRSEFIRRTQAEIDAMPSTTDGDGEARMLANLKRMRKFKFVRRPK